MTIYGKTSLQTDNAVLTDLIATRGMSGMMNTIWLISMCHVFRRGNDSQRYAGKHHIALRTFHEENGQRRIELPSVRGFSSIWQLPTSTSASS